ncbi:RNA/RNP complex-1-interacting phosphatase [Arctopsyche grandis]|uniref:RNA/RNP complex-1-interacting phosphatase n=1 Tax=Arctopsyche grandis TaxID=121162 RepID=UPI00406D94EB
MHTTLQPLSKIWKSTSIVTTLSRMADHRQPQRMSGSSGSTSQNYRRHQGYKAGKSIPDRWLDYSNAGVLIAGTRIIAFKTPLKDETLNKIDDKYRWSIEDLINYVPDLGLVIDLTFTKKYYDFENFERKGIVYKKIFCEGHVIPNQKVCQEFHDVIRDFCEIPENDGKLIGVHCTHGLNRTGYLVCHFMIHTLGWPPQRAIDEFERARGHRMERGNYINSLLTFRERYF